MASANSIEVEHLNTVLNAMASIQFSELELDESLAEIAPALLVACAGSNAVDAYEADHARMAMATSLALVAALQNTDSPTQLESMLYAAGYFDEEDEQIIQTLKAVTLDQALIEAVNFELNAPAVTASEHASRLQAIHQQVRTLLVARGHAVSYFETVETITTSLQ